MDIVARVQEMLASFRQAGLPYLDYLSARAAVSDEAVVRLKIAEPLLAALGYDLQADLDPEHRVQEGAIDILVRANGVPVMLWELKRTRRLAQAHPHPQVSPGRPEFPGEAGVGAGTGDAALDGRCPARGPHRGMGF